MSRSLCLERVNALCDDLQRIVWDFVIPNPSKRMRDEVHPELILACEKRQEDERNAAEDAKWMGL